MGGLLTFRTIERPYPRVTCVAERPELSNKDLQVNRPTIHADPREAAFAPLRLPVQAESPPYFRNPAPALFEFGTEFLPLETGAPKGA